MACFRQRLDLAPNDGQHVICRARRSSTSRHLSVLGRGPAPDRAAIGPRRSGCLPPCGRSALLPGSGPGGHGGAAGIPAAPRQPALAADRPRPPRRGASLARTVARLERPHRTPGWRDIGSAVRGSDARIRSAATVAGSSRDGADASPSDAPAPCADPAASIGADADPDRDPRSSSTDDHRFAPARTRGDAQPGSCPAGGGSTEPDHAAPRRRGGGRADPQPRTDATHAVAQAAKAGDSGLAGSGPVPRHGADGEHHQPAEVGSGADRCRRGRARLHASGAG